MTIKIKLRGNKAIIKFDSATHKTMEEQWFINNMLKLRDSDPRTHPKISIRSHDGRELPPLRPPKPMSPPIAPPVKPLESVAVMEGKPMAVTKDIPVVVVEGEVNEKKPLTNVEAKKNQKGKKA